MDDYESDEYAPIDELFGAGSEDETLFADQQAGPALFDLEPEEPAGLFDLPQDGPDLFGNLPDTSRARAISAAIRPSIKDEPAEPNEDTPAAATRRVTPEGDPLAPAGEQPKAEASVAQKPAPKRRGSKSGARTGVPEETGPTPEPGTAIEPGAAEPTPTQRESTPSTGTTDPAIAEAGQLNPRSKNRAGSKTTRTRTKSAQPADVGPEMTTRDRKEDAIVPEEATPDTVKVELAETEQTRPETAPSPEPGSDQSLEEPSPADQGSPEADPEADQSTENAEQTPKSGSASAAEQTQAVVSDEDAPVDGPRPNDEAIVEPVPAKETRATSKSVVADDPAPASDPATVEEVPAAEPEPDMAVVLETATNPEPGSAAARPGGPTRVRPAKERTEPADEVAAPLALYRRYRPDTFADVIGQEHVTDPLQRALINGKVNHAYLFSGPRGCGKTSSARILARCLNCAEGPTPTPCGHCRSCTDLARTGPGSIDVIEIDAASHGGVDDARDLRERAFFAPVHSRYKIYIIDEAHMVTTAGFNALLKLVEEPPPHVKFIFATTEPEKVIGTIRSRTHHYPFRLVPPKVLSDYLARLCQAEGVDVDQSVLPLVVRAGAGSVRDSLSILDQLLGAADISGVRYPQAAALLGYTPDTLLDEVIDAIAAGDASAVFATIDKVIEVGQDPRRFAEDLLRRLRDLIIVSAVPDAAVTGLIDVAADQAQRFATQVAGIGRGELTRAAEVLAAGLTEMRGTTAPRLHLELMCARILLPGADDRERGLHARLDRLERRVGMLQEPGPAPQWTDAPARSVPTTREQPGPGAPADYDRNHAEAARPKDQPQQRPSASGPEYPPEPDHAQPTPQPDHGRGPSVGSGQRPAGQRPEGQRPGTPDQTPAPQPQTPVGQPANRGFAQRPAGQGTAQRPAPEPQNWEGEPAAPRQTEPAGRQQGAADGAPLGQLTAVELRRIWPTILDRLKGRRRYTWMVVSQNAQVLDMTDGRLTLGFSNNGAKDSFSQRGGINDLSEVLSDEIGMSPHIIAVLSEGGPDASPQQRPVGTHTEQVTPPAPPAAAPEPAPEEQISDEDDEIIDQALSVEELLATQLGAEVIHEENSQ